MHRGRISTRSMGSMRAKYCSQAGTRKIELIVGGDTSRRHHNRVMDGFLLKADDLRETESWKHLNVEDFLYRCFEFKHADKTSAAQIHGGYAAFQTGASFSDGHSVHRGCRPDL